MVFFFWEVVFVVCCSFWFGGVFFMCVEVGGEVVGFCFLCGVLFVCVFCVVSLGGGDGVGGWCCGVYGGVLFLKG